MMSLPDTFARDWQYETQSLKITVTKGKTRCHVLAELNICLAYVGSR